MEFRPLIDFLSSVVRFTLKHGYPPRALPVFLICAVALFTLKNVEAQGSNRIDQVKAAFVLNIVRFVSWPVDSPDSPKNQMQLCLYRDNPMHQAMATIEGEEVGGRMIEIRQIRHLVANESCNILLISSNDLHAFNSEVASGFTSPMLTITDLTDADSTAQSRRGILVALVRNGTRIGFEVDLEKVRRAGLRMSSELLKLATIVGGKE